MNRLLFVAIYVLGLSAFAQQESPTSKTFPEPRQVRAKSEMKPHVGAAMGVTQPDGSYTLASEIALDIGYQPYIPFGLGLEISRAEIKSDVDRIERNTALVKLTYNFGGNDRFLRESYIGLGAGAVFRDGSTRGVLAPIVGIDFPIGADATPVSFGLNAKYALIDGDEDPDAGSIAGIVKYWY